MKAMNWAKEKAKLIGSRIFGRKPESVQTTKALTKPVAEPVLEKAKAFRPKRRGRLLHRAPYLLPVGVGVGTLVTLPFGYPKEENKHVRRGIVRRVAGRRATLDLFREDGSMFRAYRKIAAN